MSLDQSQKNFSENSEFLDFLLEKCYEEGRIACVDLLMLNEKGEILAQKRSETRELFPSCWEVPGGKVHKGESLLETLKREIKEELGMDFLEIVDFVDFFDWESGGKKYCNFQFLGRVSGTPVLVEPEKTTEIKWINKDNLKVLLENREAGDDHHYKIVQKALQNG